MKRTQEQIIALIKAGLSGEAPPLELFEGAVDWEAIYKTAFSQTIVCVVTDGISLLPDSLKPQIEVLELYLADTLATEIRNDQMDRFLVSLMDSLEKEGFRPVVLKGQCLALNYPEPSHRQSGDIDLLVPPSAYRQLRDYLVSKASQVDGEFPEILHQGMIFNNIEVEVHGAVSSMFSFSLDRKLAAEVEDLFAKDDFREVPVRAGKVRAPGDNFNAIYVMLHILRHYFTGGVGLRQISDWAMFLHANRDSIDREALGAKLRDLGLMRAWKTFGAFVVEYVGIPADSVPFYAPVGRRRLERMLSFVFKCGNFGVNESRVRKDEPYLVKKIHSFLLFDVHDKLRHFTEFPVDSLRFFFGAVLYGFRRLFNGV